MSEIGAPKKIIQKRFWGNIPKVNRDAKNQNHHNEENSFESHSSDKDYDMYRNASTRDSSITSEFKQSSQSKGFSVKGSDNQALGSSE